MIEDSYGKDKEPNWQNYSSALDAVTGGIIALFGICVIGIASAIDPSNAGAPETVEYMGKAALDIAGMGLGYIGIDQVSRYATNETLFGHLKSNYMGLKNKLYS